MLHINAYFVTQMEACCSISCFSLSTVKCSYLCISKIGRASTVNVRDHLGFGKLGIGADEHCLFPIAVGLGDAALSIGR